MVNINSIETKLEDLTEFFESIRHSSASDVDKESAHHGLKLVTMMKSALTEHKIKPSNILLKRIYGGFSSITRGIEAFRDKKLDELFDQKCSDIVSIKEDLESNIKW